MKKICRRANVKNSTLREYEKMVRQYKDSSLQLFRVTGSVKEASQILLSEAPFVEQCPEHEPQRLY